MTFPWPLFEQQNLLLRAPATEHDLAALERRWGARLPPLLRAWLEKHDGLDEAPERTFVPLRPLSALSIVDALDTLDAFHETDEHSDLRGVVLPVMAADDAEFLVVLQGGALDGVVGYWHHETCDVTLWFTSLTRLAEALPSLTVNAAEFEYELDRDYPARFPWPGDEAAGEFCLQAFRRARDAGEESLAWWYIKLAVQFWPSDRAAELQAWPDFDFSARWFSAGMKDIVEQALQARGLA